MDTQLLFEGERFFKLYLASSHGSAPDLERIVHTLLAQRADALFEGQPPGARLRLKSIFLEAFALQRASGELPWRDYESLVDFLCHSIRTILKEIEDQVAEWREDVLRYKDILVDPFHSEQTAYFRILLDEVFSELRKTHKEQYEIIAYRFFLGFTRKKIQELTGLTAAQVLRREKKAVAWLEKELTNANYDHPTL